METNHKLSDGSELRFMTARDLIRIPIWKGNRHIDDEHLRNIRSSLNGKYEPLNLSLYRIVSYKVLENETDTLPTLKSFIIDGQHRIRILNEFVQNAPGAADLKLMVIDKKCDTEREAIEYFNLINTTKPIQWKEDPNLIVNPYIRELEKVFNTSKKNILIRPGKTRKPYVSADALREEFVKRRIGIAMTRPPEEFADLVKDWNEYCINEIRANNLVHMDKSTKRALEMNFVIGLDDSMRWLNDVLNV